jgi:hypothetical protein
MPQPVNITDPTGNLLAQVSPFGGFAASIDGAVSFVDTYDGVTVDTTNRWSTAGSTVVPTQPGTGVVLINPGTAASAATVLASQYAFVPSGYQVVASFIQLENATIALGNHRFFGMGNPSGAFTAANPLQDAIGFEIDTAGVLRASVYAAAARIQTVPLSVPKDGLNHLYFVHFRPGIAFFCIDNQYQVLATLSAQPATYTLPIRFHSINGLAITTGTPTMQASVSGLVDYSRPSSANGDGQFPWRKQKIGSNGEVYQNNAIAPYPNAPTNIAYASAVDTAFSAANANRRQYIVSNDTTAKLYILIDQSGAGVSSATNFTYVIPAGGTFEMPNPVSTARVRGFWAAGGAGSAAVTDISGGTVQGSA